MSKFKVGDVVRYKDWYALTGETHTVVSLDPCGFEGARFSNGGWGYDKELELVEPTPEYEDEWHLNDGKVDIPEDADTLEKDGSVVAFRKVKKIAYPQSNNHRGHVGSS